MAEIHTKTSLCPTWAHVTIDDINKLYLVTYTVPPTKLIASKAPELYTDPKQADDAKAAWIAACDLAPVK